LKSHSGDGVLPLSATTRSGTSRPIALNKPAAMAPVAMSSCPAPSGAIWATPVWKVWVSSSMPSSWK
jgi:hypothetical protein